ncbi:Lrp/AsnC family transcriptional regulator [Dactylosporangium sp. CA-092794]|uniref:Lrp/AsnC family transcriptional regulator n=1 Tax=Dactylosporangium sp. CA-092794 TaxID=3239929 RepID=UPI003D8C58D8
MPTLDSTDARLLLDLNAHPAATRLDLGQRLGLSRNTVHARLARWNERELLGGFERRVLPESLGYGVTAFISARVDQHRLGTLGRHLAEIPEVLEVHGLAGETDLVIRVVARDTEDMYRIAGLVLSVPGVERTSVGISMFDLVPYRITPLLRRVAEGADRRG